MHPHIIKLIDRRTAVTLISLALLFTLAVRNVSPATAIDGMVMIVIALTGSNMAQRSLIAWAKYGRRKKDGRATKTKVKE